MEEVELNLNVYSINQKVSSATRTFEEEKKKTKKKERK